MKQSTPEPIGGPALRSYLRKVLADERLVFTSHARAKMVKDDMVEQDVVNVLRGGRYDGCDFEVGTWRYRVATPKMVVVVALRWPDEAVVVTAWRLK